MKTPLTFAVAALGAAGFVPHVHAAPTGMTEVSDAELATMRGRYTVDNHTVVQFGVQMVSTWATNDGRVLQSSANLSMNFQQLTNNQPTVTFTPTVTIVSSVPGVTPSSTASNTTPAPSTPAPQRQVDGSGLANVNGFVQSNQLAGNGNAVANVTSLDVTDAAPGSAGSSSTGATGVTVAAQTRTVSVGDATVTASVGSSGMQLMMQIAGQGSVQQWIASGTAGQSTQITGDMQQVSNRMAITLVRGALAQNATPGQDFTQTALSTIHGAGVSF